MPEAFGDVLRQLQSLPPTQLQQRVPAAAAIPLKSLERWRKPDTWASVYRNYEVHLEALNCVAAGATRDETRAKCKGLSLIHISEPTRPRLI
eukprot:3557449-Amphidinium_carterae.1